MEIIDLNEIKFKQMQSQKLATYEKVLAIQAANGEISKNNGNYLTDAERMEVNLIMARTYRKYNLAGTDITDLIEIPRPLTEAESETLARDELERQHIIRIDQINEEQNKRRKRQEQRKQRIIEQYQTRVNRINTDAQRRGMLQSTIVLEQLSNVECTKQKAISAIDAEIEFIESTRQLRIDAQKAILEQRLTILTKRIHGDSIRTNLASIREKAIQKSRSYRDWMSCQRLRATNPIDIQSMVDQEIYNQYVIFLSKQTPIRARNLVDHDPVFLFNLNMKLWEKLFNEFDRRIN